MITKINNNNVVWHLLIRGVEGVGVSGERWGSYSCEGHLSQDPKEMRVESC